MDLTPLSDAAGAEVRCGPLQALGDADLMLLREALLAHLVLVFPDQVLSPTEFATFARHFGPLISPPAGEVPGPHPDLHVVSNVVEDGVPIGILGDGDVTWHSDMAGFAEPPSATLLYAREVPERGDTWFANTYLAFEELPRPTQQRLLRLTIKHEVRDGSAGVGTGASHPIVCTHPETGCATLFLGARDNTRVSELSPADSTDLLSLLWAQATDPAFRMRHRWRVGDVVLWDNRCTLHRREAFDPTSRRTLWRAQVAGSRPFTAEDVLSRPPHPRGHQSVSVA